MKTKKTKDLLASRHANAEAEAIKEGEFYTIICSGDNKPSEYGETAGIYAENRRTGLFMPQETEVK